MRIALINLCIIIGKRGPLVLHLDDWSARMPAWPVQLPEKPVVAGSFHV